MRRVFSILLVAFLPGLVAQGADDQRLSVLLLGDDGHHRPAQMAKIITPVLAARGVNVTYTNDVRSLNEAALANVDCLAIYRDSGDLPPEQESALLAFVEGGKGLVAIHCASHAFRNSGKYTALVGGRFQSHEGGEFRARIIDAQHPAMRGVKSFESWDETYIHNELSADRRVLMCRPHAGGYEPWTWVRQQGNGRVYYTASGHDEKTWNQPGFQKLIEAGIRWAAGSVKDDKPPFELIDAGDGLPNYLPGQKWGTEGDRITKMQKPLSPADSMKHMHLPEGFRVELFAAEPDVIKPMAMAFDERGRLWVIESVDYPNNLLREPHKNGNDRIKICEDTDGNGRADKFTVFADKLNIPTGLQLARGGAIVVIAPHLLFLKDTNGDDVADVREILYTGFGRGDTHAVASNLHYGHDNWIYGCVGYSGGLVKAGESQQKFGQCLFRFKPNGDAFEVLTPTSNNTWGLGLGEQGDVFASTANNEHSVYLAVPNRYYEAVRGWHGIGSAGIEDHKKIHPIGEVRQMDWFGAFTAASGHELYTARSFPQEYWDRAAFVCEPTGHLIHMNWLVPEGSSFVARDGFNLLASTDGWTSPTAAQVGPDGAVWMLDWYNYVIQHNPTPHGFKTGPGNAYVTPLRDKEHGRIYRIVHESAKSATQPKLSRDDPAGLVEALGHENLLWRLTAQQLLVERGKPDVLPKLAEAVKSATSDPAALHALRAMEGLGAFTKGEKKWLPVVEVGLTHRWAGTRRAALGTLPRNESSVAMILAAKSLTDADVQVRRAALLALAEMPASQPAATAIVAALVDKKNATDEWIPIAATTAAARSDIEFLKAAAGAKLAADNRDALVATARVISEHYARGKPTSGLAPLVKALSAADPAVAEATIAGLLAGWPEKSPPNVDDALAEALASLVSKMPGTARLQVISLAQRWGADERFKGLMADLTAGLLSQVADSAAEDNQRIAAAGDLMSFAADEETVGSVLAAINAKASPELVTGLLTAIGKTDGASAGSAIVERWPSLTPTARGTALGVLARRPEWTMALLDGIERETVAASDLSIDHEQLLARHPDTKIAERAKELLAKRGRLPSADRQKVLDELLPLAEKTGDAADGKLVFEKNCAKCHRHGEMGASIGPDLTGVAVRPAAEILTEVLDPNRSVEGNFRQYTVITEDGRVLSGLLVSETKTAVELLDSEAKKQVVLRDDIEEMTESKNSVMPEGFEKLEADGLVNLLAFLTARGKYLPLPLNKVATINTTKGMFFSADSDVERLIFPDWSPKTVSDVPFVLIDPQDGKQRNAIMLYGPQGKFPPDMPKSVSVRCNAPAKAIHLLSGISGWGYPATQGKSVSVIVRLHYKDGPTEDIPLLNGEHFSDYIREVDVPGSKLAFKLRGQQIRYLAVHPKRADVINEVEFVKGPDATAPVIMAVTIEAPDGK